MLRLLTCDKGWDVLSAATVQMVVMVRWATLTALAASIPSANRVNRTWVSEGWLAMASKPRFASFLSTLPWRSLAPLVAGGGIASTRRSSLDPAVPKNTAGLASCNTQIWSMHSTNNFFLE